RAENTETENADLHAKLVDAKSAIKQLKLQLEEQQTAAIEYEKSVRQQMEDYAAACESEMDRVLQAVRRKEEEYQRGVRVSAQADHRCKELEAALQELNTNYRQMQYSLKEVSEECETLRSKLQNTERYCSTLETAHQEMKLRCEYLQGKLESQRMDDDADEGPNSIPRRYMTMYEDHYRELESDRHLDRVLRSLTKDKDRQVNQRADYGPAEKYLFSIDYNTAKSSFWNIGQTAIDHMADTVPPGDRLMKSHYSAESLSAGGTASRTSSRGGGRRAPPPPP
ncbi:unnamed protein product, partial [Symbiodinium microadriaticum]